MSSDTDSDGGETTLGSPPEPLSPCFWAGGAKRGPAAAGPVVVAVASTFGRPREEEEESEHSGDWKLAQLSDVCSSIETTLMSPPVARSAKGDAVKCTAKGQAGE